MTRRRTTRGPFRAKGKHFRTKRGTRKHTSVRQHGFFHALISRKDKRGDHTHYTGNRRGSRHAVKKRRR